jgi:hypothetical protein
VEIVRRGVQLAAKLVGDLATFFNDRARVNTQHE